MLDIRHIVGAILLFANGLIKIIKESKDFYELEEGIHELTQRISNQIFAWALEEIDTRLMKERDRNIWEVVGFRAKQVVSTFGEFIYRRRLYRNKQTGETKFLLDELLGWPSHSQITPRLREIAVKLSTEMPFRRAAEILSYLFPGISPMTIWKAVQELGEILKQDSEERRKEVFEYGEVPKGEKVTKRLYIEGVEKVYIGGDGAEWPKEGLEYFPAAEYRLDPYHLNRQLTEALWYDEETYDKVREAIYQGDLQKTEGTLREAIKRAKGERKKKLTKLLKYLLDNWGGIVNSPGTERLGAIEGQIQHNIARRMKRLGCRWTIEGGDRMSRVLAEKANGELENYTMRWPLKQEKLKEVVQSKTGKDYKAEDIEKWLKVSLPILEGPFAGRPWIKYVLKEITRANGLAVSV
ncbi:UPF0236 family transposase-like protein [Thermoanaerobacter wiegelii]|uniref:ISLre2 family transposase n=1 Tax=Thermoanaerobacter wiegelii Rt8.B1 TaxID=697303 RepID=G2MV62_9THEO|nr:UPF0236 family protein [Thermoanaerobacter wiegelii]AEM78241.1 protein of unknown function UPF0236 [Thermoanaerobacter wiegelii Rt8.B1]